MDSFYVLPDTYILRCVLLINKFSMRSTSGRFDTSKNYLCLLLSLLDNLGCGSGIKASFMPLTLHEISASLSPIP